MEKEIKKIYRSIDDRIIWGVGGGLAKYFGLDSTLVRLILVAFALITGGLGILFYFAAALIVPNEPGIFKNSSENVSDNFNNFNDKVRARKGGGIIIGTVLLIIGILAVLKKFFPIVWFGWGLTWPIIAIILGIAILIRSGRK
ncbi:MAG: PspC domain-containing protein [Candidatus Wolfebacteria bacterium]|nr:PspC domain-containing protein [Candidatus Wolfebacteria bacterium]